jgi:hypothetical protein
MGKQEDHGPKLRFVRNGRHSAITIGSIQVFVGPENMAPYPVEAWVSEEDTYLVLSADTEVFESNQEVEPIMAQLLATSPATPGSVIIKNGYPLRMLAIIHDLNQEPSWKEEWVVNALDRILRETESRRIRSLALPLLGNMHGSLGRPRFLALLREALERRSPKDLQRLWLVVPPGTTSEILVMLDHPL